MNTRKYADTPFDTLRLSYEALMADPCQLTISAAELGGRINPARDLTLPQIQAALMAKKTKPAAKRALWSAVVRRAQAGDASWTLVAAGLTYPALAGRVLKACRVSPGEAIEIQAEVLVEFLAALKQLDMDDPRVVDVAGWLAWRAFYGSRTFRRHEALASAGGVRLSHGFMPTYPGGHPDFILARALKAGVIDQDEFDWIDRTCLDDECPKVVAREYHLALSTFYERRAKAGHKLAAAIRSGALMFL